MRYLRSGVILLFLLCFAGNYYTARQEKLQQDNTIPVIKSETDLLEISIKDPADALLQGLTAYDEKDGDLTKNIMVASSSYFIEKGVTNVKYIVFDSNQNHAEYTRKVKYTDYKRPKFKLTEPLVYPVNSSAHFLDYITVKDELEGDISDSIKIVDNKVNTDEEGVYPVTLEVMNKYGDSTQVELRVAITENHSGPQIILSKYLDYPKKSVPFNARKYLKSVILSNGKALNISKDGYSVYNDDGEYVGRVKVTGDKEVDLKKKNCYQLTYSFKLDSVNDDEETAKAYLTIVVR